MTRLSLIFLMLFLASFSGNSKNLEAYFSYCTFKSPQEGIYLETYLSVVGKTLNYNKNDKNMLQGSLEVLYIFTQNEKIVAYKKLHVSSPELNDTTAGFQNFVSQERIPLENGNYMLEIRLTDLYSKEKKPVVSLQELQIHFTEDSLEVSEIEFVESFTKTENQTMFTKSGFDIKPYVSDFFPENMTKLKFYAEIYNATKVFEANDMFLVKYFIEKYETQLPLSTFSGYLRQPTQEVSVILREFNIEKLPSGNYYLVIELRNKANELLHVKKAFFQRSNPQMRINPEDILNIDVEASFVDRITNPDTIREHIYCLRPISDPMERNFVDNNLKGLSLEMMQKYFYSFWLKRNELYPETEWLNYKEQVDLVDSKYGTPIMKGYETDRGRVYLQYGSPNHVTARYNEPSLYPYEIWQYYKTNIRSDARFVFFNPSLSGENFELLHSNVYGELRDYRWQIRLQKRNDQAPNLDDASGIDHFGNQIENFFENPR